MIPRRRSGFRNVLHVFNPQPALLFEAQLSPRPNLRSRLRSLLRRSCSLTTPHAPAPARHISLSSIPWPVPWALVRGSLSAAPCKASRLAPHSTSLLRFRLAAPPCHLSERPVFPRPEQAATHTRKTALCPCSQTQNSPDKLFHWQSSEEPSSSTPRSHPASPPQGSSTARGGCHRH